VRVGIVGAGRMGQTLARLFLAAGHDVRLSAAHGPASLGPLIAALGVRASAGTTADVAAFGDVVVLATRWNDVPAAAQALGDMAGRIVIDPTNNRFGPGPADLYDLGTQSSSEVVAGLLPGARVVKAFNHQSIAALAALSTSAGSARKGLFIAGDDPAAKAVVSGLIRDIGGEPIDAGSLAVGGRRLATGSGPLAGRGDLLDARAARALLASL
jgi:predicted dinucleotide-binding enzyme